MSAHNSPPEPDDNPACDIRFGQVGLANIRVLAADPERLQAELARRVDTAPALFERTAVIMDLGHLPGQPRDDQAAALLEAIRSAGMLPVGLAYGSQAMDELSRRLGLPVIARFRDAFRQPDDNAPAAAPTPAPAPAQPGLEFAAEPKAEPTAQAGTLIHEQQVRSGQQLYAQQGDLAVTANVANGAEIIADGCIHVYSALHGRALAGAQGDARARIFCSAFHAQLISIAGHYRVFEELPEQYAGKAVQCWLENDKLRIDLL